MKMLSIKLLNMFTGVILILLFATCSSQNGVLDINSREIYVDNGVFPLMKTINDNFNQQRNHLLANIEGVNADEGIQKLLNQQIDMFVSTRNINHNELQEMYQKNFRIGYLKLCNDGIAVVSGNKTDIDKITTDELIAALMNKNQSLKVYLPPVSSGTFSFIKSRLLQGNEPINGIITSSENDILKEIKNDEYAVGLISINLVKENPDLRILPVGILRYNHKAYYYSPFNQNLAQAYPLSRIVYVLANMEQRQLAFDYAKYMLSEKGRTVISGSNLYPINSTIRSIRI
jgi:ABC-type phosphate transport system substrate-binding protein